MSNAKLLINKYLLDRNSGRIISRDEFLKDLDGYIYRRRQALEREKGRKGEKEIFLPLLFSSAPSLLFSY